MSLFLTPTNILKLISALATEATTELISLFLPLIKSMFYETNPVPVKTAMGLLGMCDPEIRLPLCQMSDKNLERLKIAMKNYGLLK